MEDTHPLPQTQKVWPSELVSDIVDEAYLSYCQVRGENPVGRKSLGSYTNPIPFTEDMFVDYIVLFLEQGDSEEQVKAKTLRCLRGYFAHRWMQQDSLAAIADRDFLEMCDQEINKIDLSKSEWRKAYEATLEATLSPLPKPKDMTAEELLLFYQGMEATFQRAFFKRGFRGWSLRTKARDAVKKCMEMDWGEVQETTD